MVAHILQLIKNQMCMQLDGAPLDYNGGSAVIKKSISKVTIPVWIIFYRELLNLTYVALHLQRIRESFTNIISATMNKVTKIVNLLFT